ncbi:MULTISPECIES: type II secretion system protein GspD [Aequorivita]|uniref:Type II and III secretion system protein n=1 Tax=Aequorivita iocasae TaxID=2803865 RepID=A0ABX7DSI1_9FLAO|nr:MULTISPECIES: type II and III secretion system protein [Aequorivita]QQX76508.1 type II and III secretion system protein [Aequorivita iocasae]UCA55980.1 type II and III secretion system protein [Aequorivita sp. F7]
MRKILLFICISFSFTVLAQTSDIQTIEAKFNEIAKTRKGLSEKIRIDISGLSLYDFITSIAEEHQLNVSVDNNLNQIVNSNFFDVEVRDVFLFLIQKYELEVSFLNSIIAFNKKEPIVIIAPPKPIPPIDIEYNKQNNFLSVKLKNDSLPRVAQKITEVSNKNVVLSPDIKTMNVSAYILNRPFDQVMEMLAKSNKLSMTIDDNGFYFLEKDVSENANEPKNNRNSKNNISRMSQSSGDLTVNLNANGYLSVKANQSDLNSIIIQAAALLDISYFLYNPIGDETTTLIANEITFDDLLEHIFKGKKYTFKKTDDLYLIGEQNTEGLRVTELVQLENRTIELVLPTLPKTLLENVEVREVIELNGIIIAGSKPKILEIKEYLREIDKIVPLVQIEVLIVQYQKSHDVQTGLKAILGDEGRDIKTEGVIFPNADVTLNSSSINNLIDSFNGFGIFNLGKVTERFYANLSALESNSIIDLQSTPKIATLSGHEASVSIGETNYYFEQTNRLINSGINENILQSGVWKPTEANLSVFIKPYVSKDEQVTLTISVEKSAFLGRAGEDAPPDKATQRFESLVRVKNNEMILLGGLDELDRQNSGSGTPLLSRIPIIKWLFSSKRKSRSKSKLHVFIKPTIVY